MNKYINPEIVLALFNTEEIVTASGEYPSNYRMLKTKVNGNEGADYGTQEVSIFTNN